AIRGGAQGGGWGRLRAADGLRARAHSRVGLNWGHCSSRPPACSGPEGAFHRLELQFDHAAERVGKALDRPERQTFLALFNPRQGMLRHSGFGRELLLRQMTLLAQCIELVGDHGSEIMLMKGLGVLGILEVPPKNRVERLRAGHHPAGALFPAHDYSSVQLAARGGDPSAASVYHKIMISQRSSVP